MNVDTKIEVGTEVTLASDTTEPKTVYKVSSIIDNADGTKSYNLTLGDNVVKNEDGTAEKVFTESDLKVYTPPPPPPASYGGRRRGRKTQCGGRRRGRKTRRGRQTRVRKTQRRGSRRY